MTEQMTRVVAVVPTYNPTKATVLNVRQLRAQVVRVVVVDDGSPPASDGVLATLRDLGVELIRLDSNRGIAHALNVGVRAALVDPTTELVLTLDQDTLVCNGYVEHAVGKHRSHRADGRVGIVVPGVVSERPVKTSRSSGRELVPMEPIQSGMLIAREVFEQIGFFREEFFIDCVDTDFFLRAARNGYLTVLCDNCSISHELGELRPTLATRPGIAVHPPFRRYYMTRNRLVVIRENARHDLRWLRHTVVAESVGFVLTLLRGSARRKQLRAVLAGVRAFRSSAFGPIPERLRARLEP